MSYTPSLQKHYAEHVVPELMKLRGYTNKHEVPRLTKVTINTGRGDYYPATWRWS